MRPGETTPRSTPTEPATPAQLPVLPAVPEPAAAELPPALTSPPGVDSLVAALRRRWQLILTIGIGGALLAFLAVWYLVPGRYAATLILSITPLGGHVEGGEMQAFSRTQAVFLKSPTILRDLLSRTSVGQLRETQEHTDDPISWLTSALTIDTPTGGGAEMLRVTLQGEYPEDLAKILEVLAQVYIDQQTAETRKRGEERQEQLRVQLNEIRTQLSGKQKEIAELRDKLGLADQRAVATEMDDLRRRLGTAEERLSQERGRVRLLQSNLDRTQEQVANPSTIEVTRADIDDRLRSDAGLAALGERLRRIDLDIRRARDAAAPGNKDRAAAPYEKERLGVESQIAAYIAQVEPALYAEARERTARDLQKKARDLQRDVDFAKAEIAAHEAAIESFKQKLGQLKNGSDPVLMQKLVDAETDETTLKTSLQRQAEMVDRAQLDVQGNVLIKTIVPPQVPRERTTDRKWKYGAAAALAAFVLAFLAVALIDFRVRRVNSVRDITQGLGLPVVGTLPLVPNRDARQLLMLDDAEANAEQLALREAVDGVRTVVLHAGRQTPLQVLLVGSALHDEGKTTLASQLATSLARSGRRTLLLDCDLRNPSCAQLFNRPATPGVCEVLRGEVPIEEAIQPTEQANLFLVPAGVCDPRALMALAQDVPGSLFEVLREHFDFIVVDTSPLLPVSDSLQIATHADAVLIAIMEQSSQLPAVHQAQQRLAALNIRVLGAVVGGTEQTVYLHGSNSRANQKPREG